MSSYRIFGDPAVTMPGLALLTSAGTVRTGRGASADRKAHPGAGDPCVTACGPLCAPFAGGAASLPLPAVLDGFGPLLGFYEGRKKSRITLKFHIFPQCGERWNRRYLHGRGRQVLPTHGWGKQSVWLATGSQTLFAGWRPHPLFAARGPKGRERNRALHDYGLCGLLDFDMP